MTFNAANDKGQVLWLCIVYSFVTSFMRGFAFYSYWMFMEYTFVKEIFNMNKMNEKLF